MNPYKLNVLAMEDYKRYHGLSGDGEVAKMLCISPSYYSLLLAGKRRLNEELRLRIQFVTRKKQEDLFIPDYEVVPFTHQSFAMGKFYGMHPYDKFSITKEIREKEASALQDTDTSRNRMRRIVESNFKCEMCGDTFPDAELHPWHINGNEEDGRMINLSILCSAHYEMMKGQKEASEKESSVRPLETTNPPEEKKHYFRKLHANRKRFNQPQPT